MFEKVVEELQQCATCHSISMMEFNLPLKRDMHENAPAKKIKELLLNFLRSEDDYVKVSRLIKSFNTLG